MPRDLNRRPSGETLSVGNVVSAGLRIYRDNFKVYYLEALKSYLWIFVPVYGWAKFAAIQAIISRLAFFEVREAPESLADARRQVMPKMWIFLVMGILISLIFLTGFVVFGIVFLAFAIVLSLLGFGFFSSIQNNPSVSLVVFIVQFIAVFSSFLTYVYVCVWLISRIAFADLAIAIDGVREATKAIGRSWTITQGFVAKIEIIFFIAFLLTIPVSVIFSTMTNSLVSSFLRIIFLQNAELERVLLWGIVITVINLLLTIPFAALFIPFWQSIKAVIYYDLLTRKEGLGLELRELNDNL
jgi:hypothetical protein